MKKLFAIAYLSTMFVNNFAVLPGHWAIQNCNAHDYGLNWKMKGNKKTVKNSLSKGTSVAEYPVELEDPIVMLSVGEHTPFLHEIGFMRAPTDGETVYVWWDAHDKVYRASFDAPSNIVTNTRETAALLIDNARAKKRTMPAYDAADEVCSEVKDAKDAAYTKAKGIGKKVKHKAKDAADKAKDFGKKATDNVKDAFENATEKAKEFTHKASKEAKNSLNTVVDKTKEAAHSVYEGAKNAYDATKEKVHSLMSDHDHTTEHHDTPRDERSYVEHQGEKTTIIIMPVMTPDCYNASLDTQPIKQEVV